MKKKYKFYDYLIVELHTKRKDYAKYFDNEFRTLSIPIDEKTSGIPTIRLHIGRKIPTDVRDGDIRKEMMFKNLFKVKYLIRNIRSDEVDIYFSGNVADRIYLKAISVFAQAELLEPVMYAKLLENDILFMHAAGVSKDEAGYIFPAHGGTGKTTLSLNLSRMGYALLGDDLLLVDFKRALVSPYPRPLHLFTYNINTLKDAKISLGLKLTVRTKDCIRFFLNLLVRQRFLISTRVHADKLYPDIQFSKPVRLKKIIFLKKDGDTEFVTFENEKEKTAAINAIIRSADLNKTLFNEILAESKEYSEFVLRKEREVVSKILDCVGKMMYVNTRNLPATSFINLLEELADEKTS